jgi:hypothetical protein
MGQQRTDPGREERRFGIGGFEGCRADQNQGRWYDRTIQHLIIQIVHQSASARSLPAAAVGAVVRQINGSLNFGSLFIYYLLRIP